MENRIDARKKDFKKSFDDPLRRREDAQLQIRKSTREAHLAKKRVQVTKSQHETTLHDRNMNTCEHRHRYTHMYKSRRLLSA